MKHTIITSWKSYLTDDLDDLSWYNSVVGLVHRLYLKDLITLKEANATLEDL